MSHLRSGTFVSFAMLFLFLIGPFSVSASPPDASEGTENDRSRIRVGGTVPELTMMAEGTNVRSEVGIAAMMPWANRLWVVTYVSHGNTRGESGVGLYEIREDLTMRRHPKSVTGTYANRYAHWPSKQAIIGPHVIDTEGTVRTFSDLTGYRIAATMAHLENREEYVYFLTMDGKLFEANVQTLDVNQVADPGDALPGVGHFKAGHTAHGRVVVADNLYDASEQRKQGILAEWDGEDWSIIDRNPYVEINGIPDYGGAIFALGFDRASVILKVFTGNQWDTYRLPKASHTYDDASNTEWYRIRQVQSERFLMDAHGMFYELAPFTHSDRVWGVRPISTHLRVVPDVTSWRGLLVLGADMQEHDQDEAWPEPGVGQPQSNLWFGNVDDLWSWGEPSGWGGPWIRDQVSAGDPSVPYLMTGFDNKVLHLSHDHEDDVTFTIEVDFLGDGTWKSYKQVTVPAGGYKHHTFPDGYSAHWVRIRSNQDCRATAYFTYN